MSRSTIKKSLFFMISLPHFDPKHTDLFLREVLDSAHEAVVGESWDGKIALVNARFLELAGWAGDYHCQPLDDLVASWASRAAHPQALETYFESCRSGGSPEGSVELQPNPGQIVEAQFRVVTDQSGARFRFWYFQEWRTSALAWVSHEIKNPLNAVLGFSELLAEALGTAPLPEAVQESLRGLRIGAKHLQSVLGDLLDLSRLESGVVEPHPEWTSVRRFLEDISDLFKTRFRRRGLEFLVEPAEGCDVELWIDSGRLTQILGNLLSNSLRFTKRGWVALKVKNQGPAWEFAVEDSGVGIPLDQQKTIFDPFVQKQGQDSQKFGGSGLGLAICRTLAQSMGGRLGLVSEPGSGSRFSVIFDHVEFRPESVGNPTDSTGLLPGTTLLVADDERSNHLLIQGFLRGSQVKVLSAFDGLQAVELWKQHRPTLVLMDLRMPRLSGLDTARRIMALDSARSTRFLAMSATKQSISEVAEGKNIWMDFLEKPFDKKEILKFLAKHLTFVDESST